MCILPHREQYNASVETVLITIYTPPFVIQFARQQKVPAYLKHVAILYPILNVRSPLPAEITCPIIVHNSMISKGLVT